MRLIDADALMSYVRQHWEELYPKDGAMIDAILVTPTVDAVEVVRCKDCCHSLHNEFFDTYCCWKFSWGIPVEKDGFCSWAERRNNETD